MKVEDVDWVHWQADEVATLLFVVVNQEVLLIRKKRGLGAGKINGPGGRLEAGETPMECAIRETQEELCINPLEVQARGQLFFHSCDTTADKSMPKVHAHIFTATNYEGVATETDEAVPLWTPISRIPFDEMWEDDIFWLPEVLSGRSVEGRFTFIGESLQHHQVTVQQSP